MVVSVAPVSEVRVRPRIWYVGRETVWRRRQSGGSVAVPLVRVRVVVMVAQLQRV